MKSAFMQCVTSAKRELAVQVAGADGNEAVITAGLEAGQIVVTAGVHVLTPGQKVKFYVDPGAPPASAASAALGSPETGK